MLRFVVFDNRKPDKCLHTERCFSKEDGMSEGRHYIRQMFQDPDDGVVPLHLCVRVEKEMFITQLYDDAFPKEIHTTFECDKELQAVKEALQGLEVLKQNMVRPVGRFTFRLIKLWSKC